MGKVKRSRAKLHLSSVKSKESSTSANGDSANEIQQSPALNTSAPGWNITSNIFENMDIDVDQLNTKLPEDDAVSVRTSKSISKSIKHSLGGITLPKAAKRKLRHELFIEKIDTIYKEIAETRKKKKKKNKGRENSSEKAVTSEVKEFERKKKEKKHRPVKKAKQRQKDLVTNVNFFKKVMADPKLRSQPLEAVSEIVQKKVVHGVL